MTELRGHERRRRSLERIRFGGERGHTAPLPGSTDCLPLPTDPFVTREGAGRQRKGYLREIAAKLHQVNVAVPEGASATICASFQRGQGSAPARMTVPEGAVAILERFGVARNQVL